MDQRTYKKMRRRAAKEIARLIMEAADKPDQYPGLYEIQPVTGMAKMAGGIAASALLGYERGYDAGYASGADMAAMIKAAPKILGGGGGGGGPING